jgi:Flp pilus assembly pilin Flp
LVIPGGCRSFRGASTVSLPLFLREELAKHQLSRRAATSDVPPSPPDFLERGMVAGRTRDEHSDMTRPPVLRFFRRETGQTMAEYSVVLAVITPAIVAVLVLYSNAMVNAFQRAVDAIS